MFRRLSGISIMCHSIDKVWDTYTNVLGLKARPNTQRFEKGRYNQHTFRIGETNLWLLESMDPPEAPGPGGGMARFLRRRGEGLYMVTVGLGDEPGRYAQRLESKGVKVYWDVPDSGAEVGGASRRIAFQTNVHPLVHPRSAHGVLWEMSRYVPGSFRQRAPANNPFQRIMTINIVCYDIDATLKTYTDVFELDPLVGSTVSEKAGFKEHTLGMGDVALEFRQPLHSPEAPTRGGDMARALQEHGEGIYSVSVDLKDPEKYAQGLETKGVQVNRVAVENGETVAGRPKPATPEDMMLYIIGPRHTHGVLWELGHFGTPSLAP